MNLTFRGPRRLSVAVLLLCGCAATGRSAVHPITLSPPAAAAPEFLPLGEPAGPNGSLRADAQSLWRDDRRWAPVLGEFHYSRYPAAGWREELLRMKAGGVDVVSTYVFWIHHEEERGRWDWSGRRDLRRFLETAREAGLLAIVRIGPWAHGEVRNGGLPDWLLEEGGPVRTSDPRYLEHVRVLYRQIASQVDGLLWSDGGPVVGVQLENEYRGPAEHLLTLKRLAREAGLEVPLYTRTGWPELATPMPYGEVLPLYGGYAEGFWDRELTAMPGTYWAGFRFSTLRSDRAIASEQLGERRVEDEPDAARYPYLTCEIGGGMMSSYHRRIPIDPGDVLATTLVKLGSGSTSPGYYMYHGGVNPTGRRTPLMESQATPITNWNDLPRWNYDFQAPLGAAGQVRPHYHLLRRLHLFLADFGAHFAGLGTTLPDERPRGRDEVETLRWAVRSDGRAGYVFVNTYERGRQLPAQKAVQFALTLVDNTVLTWPSTPVDVPASASFFWPFRFRLAREVRLDWATAQPVCAVREESGRRTVFFAALPGVPVELAFSDSTPVAAAAGETVRQDGRIIVRNVPPGRAPAVQIGDQVQIVVLDEADSLALWQGRWHGRERAFLTRAALTIEGETVRLRATNPDHLRVRVYPPIGDEPRDGLFERRELESFTALAVEAEVAPVKPAGPLRPIRLGAAAQPVAAAPVDEDFAAAAEWRVTLPEDVPLDEDLLLRIDYVGDVARVRIGNRVIMDDFYHGRPLEVGLATHEPALQDAGRALTIAILPLQKGAPIHLPDEIKPDFGAAESVVELRGVELVPRYSVRAK